MNGGGAGTIKRSSAAPLSAAGAAGDRTAGAADFGDLLPQPTSNTNDTTTTPLGTARGHCRRADKPWGTTTTRSATH